MVQQQSWILSCDACGKWGQKDNGTVKIDVAALHARGKENTANPNIVNDAREKLPRPNDASKAEQEKVDHLQKESGIEGVCNIKPTLVEKARQQQEWEAKQAELSRQEQERKAMELRVKEEHERFEAEEQRREAERRQILMEEMQQREAELLVLHQKQEQERKLEEEAKDNARKMQEEVDKKKINAWLQANGFKEINQLVRKRLSKVTPLQCAIQQKNIEMMMLLLQHGADASKVNGKNESALTVARKMDKKGSHAAVVQALKAYLK